MTSQAAQIPQLLLVCANNQRFKVQTPRISEMQSYLQQTLKSKITTTFQNKGYPMSKFIQEHTFFQLLDELKGDTFNEEIANGLWDQIEDKSNEEASMELIVKVVSEAIISTMGNVAEEEAKIKVLQARGKELEQGAEKGKEEEVKKINEEIGVLSKDLAEFKQDLETLTVPFGIKLPLEEDPKLKKNPEKEIKESKQSETKSEQELEWAIQTAMAIEQILM